MSEKITFRELIESIAEETNNSKQFTHDFIKDFVDVINNGLEQDGNVNIAGFGKFELRQMDEREGYNPQTEEKITIPAHNKVVFKPYKDLREVVNAPYAHLEAELIEEETDTKEDVQDEDRDASNQDDFIPTAPPTSHQQSEEFADESNADEELPFDLDDDEDVEKEDIDLTTQVSDTEADQETGSEDTEDLGDPFDLDEDYDDQSSSPLDDQETDEEDDNGDVVEFNADNDTEREEKEEAEESNLDNFITPIESAEESTDVETSEEQSEETPEELTFEEDEPESFDELESTGEETQTEEDAADEESIEDEIEEETNPFAPDFVDETKEEDKKEEDKEELTHAPSFSSQRQSRNATSKLPIIAAAAVVLLLIAAGAWYFTSLSTETPQMTVASETESTTDIVAQKNDRAEAENNQAAAQTTQQNQNQQVTTSSAGTAQPSNKKATNIENLEIQQGETLWSIAEKKYGNPRLWPWIYGNNEPLEDPDVILAGSSLTVPLPSGPENTLNSADSVGVAKGFISTYRWYKDNESNQARDHLWAAKSYHQDIRGITDIKIDKADLVYANQAR